jgi:hypothetical protein
MPQTTLKNVVASEDWIAASDGSALMANNKDPLGRRSRFIVWASVE